jgi:hypothetical protein
MRSRCRCYNKQDSMYTIAIGDYELYVPVHLKELAVNVFKR